MTNNDKKRILVVDDQPQNTQLLKAYLERNDYVVREENNSRTALSAGEDFKPDLILLDVMMPGVDGGELAARFKASPTLKTIPIVFLTATVTKAEVNAGGGMIGGNRFLAKPLVLTDVLACLKQCLNQQESMSKA
jgi:CheY-like chemotaxis protein